MERTEQKEIAIKCLEVLDIYKPYIRKFKSAAGMPCFFENYGGFYVDQEPEVYQKVKELETEYECLVYALTHELTGFGECWTMLCVPKDCDGIDECLSAFNQGEHYAFSYVWNKSNPTFSEFGDVVVRAAYGGIKRIG